MRAEPGSGDVIVAPWILVPTCRSEVGSPERTPSISTANSPPMNPKSSEQPGREGPTSWQNESSESWSPLKPKVAGAPGTPAEERYAPPATAARGEQPALEESPRGGE